MDVSDTVIRAIFARMSAAYRHRIYGLRAVPARLRFPDCESGPAARPLAADWVRSIRE